MKKLLFCILSLASGFSFTQNTITTDSLSLEDLSWCFGQEQELDVYFTSNGVFDQENIYSAQLSDSLGSFDSTYILGTLASSSNGALSISAIISDTTYVGSGYRIRVVASDQTTIATDNGLDLTVWALPHVTFDEVPFLCFASNSYHLIEGSPEGGNYVGAAVINGEFHPKLTYPGSYNTVQYYYVDTASGCVGIVSQEIWVDPCDYWNVVEYETPSFDIYPNPTSSKLTIDTEIQFSEIKLLGLDGSLIKSFEPVNTLNIEGIPSGIYLVDLSLEDRRFIERIVIK